MLATFIKIDRQGGLLLLLVALVAFAILMPERFDATVVTPAQNLLSGVTGA